MSSPPPRLLTIAGSDSGGGAGIQADLKTFAAHGVYGMSVVTAVTAQSTTAVTAVHDVPVEVVAAQLEAVFSDLGVDAVKIGMLSSVPILRAVAAALRARRPRHVVLDPVMVSKSGAPLLQDDAVAALAEELLPLSTLVTPNLPEAARLTSLPVASLAEREVAARALAARGPAVLLKGGHGAGDADRDEVADLLVAAGGAGAVRRFVHPRLATRSDHGTGCTLSSAIAARLALGAPLEQAVGGAIDYLHGAIAGAYPLGAGRGPVDHLWRLFPEAVR